MMYSPEYSLHYLTKQPPLFPVYGEAGQVSLHQQQLTLIPHSGLPLLVPTGIKLAKLKTKEKQNKKQNKKQWLKNTPTNEVKIKKTSAKNTKYSKKKEKKRKRKKAFVTS